MLRLKSFTPFLSAAVFSAALPAFAEELLPTSAAEPAAAAAAETVPAAAAETVPAAAAEPIPLPPPPAALRAPAPKLATSPLPPPPMERRSTAAMVSGIVLTSAAGLAVFSLGFTAMADCGDSCGQHDNIVKGTLIGGAIALAAGLPLLIYGAKRVPADSSQSATLPLPKWAGAPSAAGWGWSL